MAFHMLPHEYKGKAVTAYPERTATRVDDDRDNEEGEPRRPKVVDKRISAGGHRDRPAPAPTPPEPAPSAAGPSAVAPEPPAPSPQAAPPAGPPGEESWTPEQRAQAEQMAREIVETRSVDWVINVAINLANVAGAKLELGAPADAQLVIDALAAIVGSVGDRLEDAEAPLKQTLAQLQLAYAQRMSEPGAAP